MNASCPSNVCLAWAKMTALRATSSSVDGSDDSPGDDERLESLFAAACFAIEACLAAVADAAFLLTKGTGLRRD